MTYATLADLIARVGVDEIRQVADRDLDGTPDPDVIEAALLGADDTIDGYVFARYSRPLPSVPPVLKSWAVSIARYMLHLNGAPDYVEKDYKDAEAKLKDVQAGRYALPVAIGEQTPQTQTGTVMSQHPPEVFTAQKLRGW
jgi:phage gp36-like protein